MTDIIKSEKTTPAEIRVQVNEIQQLMASVMKPGTHYGTIPGAGDKPALFKPGAEKLFMLGKIRVFPEIEEQTRTPDEYSVRVKAVGKIDDAEIGSAFGEASTNEEKYKWRKAICDEEFEATPESQRRVAYKKKKGGGHYTVNQIRTQVADISNTVLKMAVKRAEIALCLQITAASDIFTQDIEDIPPEQMDIGDQNDDITMPKKKTKQPAKKKPDNQENLKKVEGFVTETAQKEGESKGKKWVKYGIKIDTVNDEVWASTFDKKLADQAEELKDLEVVILAKDTGKYGLEIVSLTQKEGE